MSFIFSFIGIKSVTHGFVSSLYISLKDHNNEDLLHFFAQSQTKCLKAEAESKGIELDSVQISEGLRYSSSKLTSLWIKSNMDKGVSRELKKAVDNLKGLMALKLVDLTSEGKTRSLRIYCCFGLIEKLPAPINFFNFESNFPFRLPTEFAVVAAPRPVNRLMQSFEAVKLYMIRFNYGIYDGSIFKKAPAAKYTYVYSSSVYDFIHFILGSPAVADQIVSHVQPLINLLSVSSCRIIKPIVIDYNFIEVTPFGTCFNIKEKRFEIDPPDLKGIC